MAETYLHQLSMQNAAWLAARQAVISSNVANANTPGFKAVDIRPFSEVVGQGALAAAVSNANHMTGGGTLSSQYRLVGEKAWETFHSGGNVNLEQEMIKASQVSADYRLNTSIMRSFHRMFLSVTGA
ncbi:MAG: flagellar biosynthesis protein FlgB [Alphaproteobacteria bacterium]|nr:MAG: flagellar biosynthesis protein FlgB [Alphaproteobacteria bacterium]